MHTSLRCVEVVDMLRHNEEEIGRGGRRGIREHMDAVLALAFTERASEVEATIARQGSKLDLQGQIRPRLQLQGQLLVLLLQLQV